MKVCQLCGETYLDFIDFCFNDGEVLVSDAAQAMDVPEPSSLATAPAAKRVVRPASQSGPTRTATPIPRSNRRSLINRSGRTGTSDEERPTDPRPAVDPALASADTTPPAARRSATPSPAPIQQDPSDQIPLSQQTTRPFAKRPRPDLHTAQTDDIGMALAELRREDSDRRFYAFVLLAAAGLLFLTGGGLLLVGVGVLGSTGASHPPPPPEPEVPEPSLQEAAPRERTPEVPASLEEGELVAEGAEVDPEDDPTVTDIEAPDTDQPGVEVDGAEGTAPVQAEPTDGGSVAVADASEPDPPAASDTPWATTVRVRSRPTGAKVLIDGQERGVTPLKVGLAPGPHMIELRKTGYESHTQLLDVGSEEVSLPPVALTQRGEAATEAAPLVPVMVYYHGREGQQLFVDGKPQGTLPVTTQLDAGMHTFKVSGASGEVSVTREVKRVASGKTIIKLDEP